MSRFILSIKTVPMRFAELSILLFLFVATSCERFGGEVQPARFERVKPGISNVTFSNVIRDNDSINILTYEYLYNGGGVGVPDINNDGLPDLFFTGSQVPNALYLNRGNFQFEDISATAGIELPGEWCTGVSIVDINYDGYDDIYVCVGGMGNANNFPNKLFINQGDLTFKESAKAYGLADTGESVQAVFFDYDRDGDLDVYLLTGGGFERPAIVARPMLVNGENRNTDRLYQNTYDTALGHPVFRNVSREAGIMIEGFGLGVCVLDANNDSWPDVYVCNDYISRDLLYINNRNGTFTDQSLSFFKHTSHFSMGADAGDINNDGLPDIVTVDMLPANIHRRKRMFGPNDHDRFYMAVNQNYNYQYMRNMLHLNHGNDGFSEIGQLAGIHRTDWSWAPLLADFDHDGYQDLYITNGFGKDVTDLDFVKFRESVASRFTDRRKLHQLFLDSLLGRPSVTLPNYIFRNERNLTFSDYSIIWGITEPSLSNGAAYADLDGDGDLEIIVNNINQEAFIYKNMTMEGATASNYVKIKLEGPATNVTGIGATVSVYANEEKQVRFQQVVRGFQSSVDKVVHVGVGASETVDSIVVLWPDGRKSQVSDIPANGSIIVSYTNSKSDPQQSKPGRPLLSPVNVIAFTHRESDFNDFKNQPLLLHSFSNAGPAIAVADVNADGLDDVFIGGAYQSNGTLYIQLSSGEFEERSIPGEQYEDTGAVFFDADNDGDFDLYVASGGSERYARHTGYQDRLYRNDGKGNFVHDPSALPDLLSSTACVAAADFDQDGDIDLFVGGRVIPGEYPKPPSSYVLENRSGTFADITDAVNPALRHIGMVTSALWTDTNNDGRPDLLLAGELMRITLFSNEGAKLIEITDKTTFADSYGMWNSLTAADFDNDGDMDYIAGNLGLNNPFRVSPSTPLEVHYADFDGNGSVDPIFCSYEHGKSYPLPSLDQLQRQLPMLKKHLLHYRDYARATAADLLRLTGAQSYNTLQCKILASCFIENLGDNRFSIRPLPLQAQFAPVYGVAAEDLNADGLLDVVLTGNFYGSEVSIGRYDASTGVVLLNKNSNRFEPVASSSSGFVVNGDARAIARVEVATKGSVLLVSRNNAGLLAFRINTFQPLGKIELQAHEVAGLARMKNGTQRKLEFFTPQSYLSQHSKSVVLAPTVVNVELFNANGSLSRAVPHSPDSIGVQAAKERAGGK